jgi:hypothetical protein
VTRQADGSLLLDLVTGGVTADHLAANSVGSSEIATGAVGNAELATNAVDGGKIAADAVGASEIQAGAVGAAELADNAVDTAAIQDGAVTAAKVAADVATQAELDAVSGYYIDSQVGSIVADGPLTGISVTPAAGTYLVWATAMGSADGAGNLQASIDIAKDGVKAVVGDTVILGLIGASGQAPLQVMGSLTADGSDVITVEGDLSVGDNIFGGTLILHRVA